MMSNVLDVEIPRRWVRIPLLLPLAIIVFWYVSGLTFLVLMGFYLIVSNALFYFKRGEWPPIEIEECLMLSIFLLLCFFTFIMARNFLARLLPGNIQIIAVKIVKKGQNSIGTFYWFMGGSIARIIQSLANFAPPLTLSFQGSTLLKLNFSHFGKKSHKILYLDEKRHIALAAEKCWGGGAVLLDENLTFLKLNKWEKKHLLSRLHTEQMALTKDRNRLNMIVKAIGASRR